MTTLAETLLAADRDAALPLAAALLKPLANNLVERPWGGVALREHKGLVPLPAQIEVAGQGIGEAFEISAYSGDAEARAHPSVLELADGSRIALGALLERHGERLLGRAFVERYGTCFPLLPKTLDIKELLSVQGHPAGHTEAYVVIAADPGATIRLGFNRDIDPRPLAERLHEGRRLQRRLLEALPAGFEPLALQHVIAPWLAERARPSSALRVALESAARPRGLAWNALESLALELRDRYWEVLDLMNAVPVAAGDVIYNATPLRLAARDTVPAAEVHALGNPEGREIVLLEIRRPGPTLRAWDNVRFPVREIDIEGALAALNLRRTGPEDFLVEPRAVPGQDGRWRLIDSEYFSVECLRLAPGAAAVIEAEPPHSLHAIAGKAELARAGGGALGTLACGESALVPTGVGAYRVESDAGAEIVKASLPEGA